MPAKKRGKGKKGNKASPKKKKGAAAAKPPKTPSASSAAASKGTNARKRKAKEDALVLTVPRRVSPRLLAKRKMQQENGFGSHEDDLTLPIENDHEHRGIGSSKPSSSRAAANKQMLLKGAQDPPASADADVSVDAEEHGDGVEVPVPVPDEDEAGEDEEDLDQMIFQNGTGPEKELQVKKIIVSKELKEAEEKLAGHAVLLYFWRSEISLTSKRVKEWIRNVVGDPEAIGHVQHCRDMGRGFFLVVFQLAIARLKALALKPKPFGFQVTVFPWCPSTVNNEGEQCSPRMIVLPGLPDQFLLLLPKIGNSLGSYIGCVGALDPDANLEAAREEAGWETAYTATPAWAAGTARIAVMMPPEVRIPKNIELELRAGVCKKQSIYEEGQQIEAAAARKRVAAAAAAVRAGKRLKNKN